jgi:hypothetical protein
MKKGRTEETLTRTTSAHFAHHSSQSDTLPAANLAFRSDFSPRSVAMFIPISLTALLIPPKQKCRNFFRIDTRHVFEAVLPQTISDIDEP